LVNGSWVQKLTLFLSIEVTLVLDVSLGSSDHCGFWVLQRMKGTGFTVRKNGALIKKYTYRDTFVPYIPRLRYNYCILCP